MSRALLEYGSALRAHRPTLSTDRPSAEAFTGAPMTCDIKPGVDCLSASLSVASLPRSVGCRLLLAGVRAAFCVPVPSLAFELPDHRR
jgi:hypothetical protein